MSSKRWKQNKSSRLALLLMLVVGLAACELRDPVVVTYDTADPALLITGAERYFGDGLSTALLVGFVASDEGHDPRRMLGLVDETGDASVYSFTELGLTYLSQARELVRMAIERARETGEPELVLRGHALNSWVTIEMARRWGDQPLVPRGEVYSVAEIYRKAIDEFDLAIELSSEIELEDDDLQLSALAGKAWTLWELGKEEGDSELMSEALQVATTLLQKDPDYSFNVVIPSADMMRMYASVGILTRGEGFEYIPFDWDELSPADNRTPKLMDADGLRLIIADIHLRSNDIASAKDVLEEVALLPVNHIELAGRDPQGEPLTEAEVSAFIDSLDADGVRHAIDELWRENFFGQGRRNVGPNGPIYPITLPPHAF